MHFKLLFVCNNIVRCCFTRYQCSKCASSKTNKKVSKSIYMKSSNISFWKCPESYKNSLKTAFAKTWENNYVLNSVQYFRNTKTKFSSFIILQTTMSCRLSLRAYKDIISDKISGRHIEQRPEQEHHHSLSLGEWGLRLCKYVCYVMSTVRSKVGKRVVGAIAFPRYERTYSHLSTYSRTYRTVKHWIGLHCVRF